MKVAWMPLILGAAAGVAVCMFRKGKVGNGRAGQ